MDINSAAAQWILGIIPNEQLPEIAMSAIEAGIDEPLLYTLANMRGNEVEKAAGVFVQILGNLGLNKVTKNESMLIYATDISRLILEKKIEPYTGAKNIWRAALKNFDNNFHDVDPFIYAASEYEDRPQDRKFFSKAILVEAQNFIDRTQFFGTSMQ